VDLRIDGGRPEGITPHQPDKERKHSDQSRVKSGRFICSSAIPSLFHPCPIPTPRKRINQNRRTTRKRLCRLWRLFVRAILGDMIGIGLPAGRGGGPDRKNWHRGRISDPGAPPAYVIRLRRIADISSK
jgi:hypothetical protein